MLSGQLKDIARMLVGSPLRHIVQNSILMIPGTQFVQMKRYTTGAMNRPDTMVGWARQVMEAAREAGIHMEGAKLAEVGPGHSLGVAVSLLLAGAAEIAALDVKRFIDIRESNNLGPVAELFLQTKAPKDIHHQLEEALQRLRYAIVRDDGNWPLADSSMDIVYSFFSGEHLRKPGDLLAETYRVLRPGGLCIHAIDLRNHLDWNGNWLQHLYYEDWLWDAMTSRRGHWTNRLLMPHWRDLFEEKFELLTFQGRKCPAPPGFERSHLARAFKLVDQEVLEVDYLWVVARRPRISLSEPPL